MPFRSGKELINMINKNPRQAVSKIKSASANNIPIVDYLNKGYGGGQRGEYREDVSKHTARTASPVPVEKRLNRGREKQIARQSPAYHAAIRNRLRKLSKPVEEEQTEPKNKKKYNI